MFTWSVADKGHNPELPDQNILPPDDLIYDLIWFFFRVIITGSVIRRVYSARTELKFTIRVTFVGE